MVFYKENSSVLRLKFRGASVEARRPVRGCCSNPWESRWQFEPRMYMFLFQELLYINKRKMQDKYSRKPPKLTNNMRYKSLISRKTWIKTMI